MILASMKSTSASGWVLDARVKITSAAGISFPEVGLASNFMPVIEAPALRRIKRAVSIASVFRLRLSALL